MNLDKLKAVAMAATPGDWETRRNGVVIGGVAREYTNGTGRDQLFMACVVDRDNGGSTETNAEHVATFDPPTVLKMIAVLEAAKRAHAYHEQLAKICRCELTSTELALASALKALEEA